jgi:signal transduction histidine kinase
VGEALGDACVVLLPGGSGGLAVAAAHGPDADFATRAGALAAEADVRAAAPAVVHLADEQGAPLAVLALAPLRAAEAEVGVLVAARPPGDPAFADVEVELLAGYAAQAAPALLAARRHAERDASHRTLVARARELEVLVEELESFAYAVAHDLRKPLRAIDGFTEAVLQDAADGLDERALDHLRRVRDNAERMTLLVEDLLVLSRVTRREMRREAVDLSALVREVARDLPDPGSARAVDLAVEEGLRIDGDPGLLRIVLSNLLGNAWKFTARTPDARIEVGRAEGAPGEPVFFVRDNGAGFDMAQAAHLFEPFRRLHRQDDFPGTGVGLATCQRIIRRHGGRIWAEGAVGRGATFFFSLPT